MNLQKSRRKRGVVLTPEGLLRLQNAIQEMEMNDNDGKRYSLEELGERIRIAPKTVSKVFDCQLGTDRRTLEFCFSAFDLELSPWDYEYCVTLDDNEEEELPPENPMIFLRPGQITPPGGAMILNSPFYLERLLLEEQAYSQINKPGGLVRLKALKQSGKTSLIYRLLHYADKQGFMAISLDLERADRDIFASIGKTVRWLCASIAQQLGRRLNLNNYWDEDLGSKISATLYLEEDVLTALPVPLVLAIDNLHLLLEHPPVAEDFFSLLRTWHEEARESTHWGKLRLIVAYTTECYVPFNRNYSPFNVGLSLDLAEFSLEELEELSKRYGLSCLTSNQARDKLAHLLDLVGGHPYLIQVALYHIAQDHLTLDAVLLNAPHPTGIYSEHLRMLLAHLLPQPELVKAMATIVATNEPIDLEALAASPITTALTVYKLKCLGLITLANNRLTPRCELYRLFFRQQLSPE